MASRKCDFMIKCVPLIIPTPYGKHGAKIVFDVTLVEVDANIGNIHTTYGYGACFQGKEIGKACVILAPTIIENDLEVLFLSGYRKDGEDFCVETEKSIIKACRTAAKAFWG